MLKPHLVIVLGLLAALLTILGPAVCSLVAEAQKAGVA